MSSLTCYWCTCPDVELGTACPACGEHLTVVVSGIPQSLVDRCQVRVLKEIYQQKDQEFLQVIKHSN